MVLPAKFGSPDASPRTPLVDPYVTLVNSIALHFGQGTPTKLGSHMAFLNNLTSYSTSLIPARPLMPTMPYALLLPTTLVAMRHSKQFNPWFTLAEP